MKFSQKLVEETIKCLKEENGVDITPEQADEYVDSLARLFQAFDKTSTLLSKKRKGF